MVIHTCSECGRTFGRRGNMIRHLETIHPDREDEKSKDGSDDDDNDAMESDTHGADTETNDEDTDNEDTDEDDNSEDADDDGDEEDDDDGDDDDDDDADADTYNVWKYLTRVAFENEDIQAQMAEVQGRLADDELSDAELRAQTLRVVKPDIVNMICKSYANFLKLWHFAKDDKTYRKIMATKRKLMDEDDFGPDEAIEQAVKKRKFLIRKATGLLDDEPLEDTVPPPSFDKEEAEDTGEEDAQPVNLYLLNQQARAMH